MAWDTKAFLASVYDVVVRGEKIQKLESLLDGLPWPEDVDAVLAEMTPEKWWAVVDAKREEQARARRRRNLWMVFAAVGLLLLVFMGSAYWVYQRHPDRVAQMFSGTYTPTPTNTPASTVTPSPTVTSTPTPTITPTATPIPPSMFLVPNIVAMDPKLPVGAERAWMVDEGRFNVKIDFGNVRVWYSAASSDPDAGLEGYHYTKTGDVTISWMMDAPLEKGVYGVYILDPQEHLAGKQRFDVLLDGIPAKAWRGQSEVLFADKGQSGDGWLSLGFYEVVAGQRLSVRAEIVPRTESKAFAHDRVLIVRLRPDQVKMLQQLPSGRMLIGLQDDDGAVFYTSSNGQRLQDEYQGQTYADVLAWRGGYRSLDLTGERWKVNIISPQIYADWLSFGRLPSGKYELYAWIPEQHATAVVSYVLLANGVTVERDAPAQLKQQDHTGWVSLGLWELPQDAAVNVRIVIKNADQSSETAEIGLDAVALLRVQP